MHAISRMPDHRRGLYCARKEPAIDRDPLTPETRRALRKPAAALASLYLVLATGFAVSVPLFETPDEPSHLHYIGFVAEEGRPPVYGKRPEVPGEGMQAPLFYLATAPFYRFVAPPVPNALAELRRVSLWTYEYAPRAILANRWLLPAPKGGVRQLQAAPAFGSLRPLRAANVLVGAVALLLTLGAVARLGLDAETAWLAGAIVAFNPQFLFISGSVSNEPAAAAMGAGVFFAVAPALRTGVVRGHDFHWLAFLGFLALATKLSSLGVVAAGIAALMLLDRRPRGERLRDLAIAGVLGLVLSAPLLYWNAAYRGDPFGISAVYASAANFRGPGDVGGAWTYFTGLYPELTFRSYWAHFGWMNLPAPIAVLGFFAALCWAAIAGLVVRGRSRTPGDSLAPRVGLYLGGSALVMLAAHVWLNVSVVQPQGRHLFPASSQSACLLAIGLRCWLVPRFVVAAFTAVLASVAAYCLLGVVIPAYTAA